MVDKPLFFHLAISLRDTVEKARKQDLLSVKMGTQALGWAVIVVVIVVVIVMVVKAVTAAGNDAM